MYLFLTLLGSSILCIGLADAEDANEPFTAFQPFVGADDEYSDVLAESSDTDILRVERQTGYAYQPQFTAYQPQAPAYQPIAQAYQPAAPAYDPYASYNVQSPAGNVEVVHPAEEVVLPSEEVTELPPQILTTPAPTFKDLIGFDLAEKIRRDSDAVQAYMRTLTTNKNALSFLNELVETNPCISSVEGTILVLERGTSVIEKAAPELEKLFVTLQSLRGERNITTLVLGTADMLKQLDSLFPKLDSFSLFLRCRTSPQEGIDSMRDLAQILYRMSLVDDPKFTQPIKDTLLQSAIFTEAVTNFLDRFQKNLAERDCYTSTDFLGEGINLAAAVIDGIAEVLGVIGKLPAAKEARSYAAFARSTVVSIDNLEEFKVKDDCSPGALLRGANLMNDFANLIGDIGLEALSIQLGISFRLDLLP